MSDSVGSQSCFALVSTEKSLIIQLNRTRQAASLTKQMALEDVAVYTRSHFPRETCGAVYFNITRGWCLAGSPLNGQESLLTLAVTRVMSGVSEVFADLMGKNTLRFQL